MTHETLDGFRVGQRIELHPATDQWMQGQRYAEVVKVGRKVITVRTDAGRTYRVPPRDVLEIIQ